jgi:hypothetical protein
MACWKIPPFLSVSMTWPALKKVLKTLGKDRKTGETEKSETDRRSVSFRD